jgi:hypothetical protein
VRSLLIASALVISAACARPSLDLNAVPSRVEPDAAAAVIGMWSGLVYESEADPGTPFMLVQVRQSDGTVGGQLAFTGSSIPIADLKVLEASGTHYVALVGPFTNARDSVQIVARLEGQLVGRTLSGTIYSRSINGGKPYKGRFTAERARRLDTI